MSSKFIGVTGKENILNSLSECLKDIISPEVKQIVEEAIDYGCIFEEEDEPGTNRQKRAVGVILAKAACMLLDAAAYALEQAAEFAVAPTFDTQKGFYYFCNEQTQYWAHLFTLGVCSVYTLAVNVDEAKKGRTMDYKGMANVLSGFSFLIGLFTGANIRRNISSISGIKEMGKHVAKKTEKVLINKAKSTGCEIIGAVDGTKIVSSVCKGYLLVTNLRENYGEIKEIRQMLK